MIYNRQFYGPLTFQQSILANFNRKFIPPLLNELGGNNDRTEKSLTTHLQGSNTEIEKVMTKIEKTIPKTHHILKDI